MSIVRRRQFDHTTPPSSPPWQGGAWRVALADLCGEFFENRLWVSSCTAVEADDIPQPARDLLVHHQHMTATLKTYYGHNVELRVLADTLESDQYMREIVLTIPGSGRVVEFGIVRLDLRFIDQEVRSAILGRSEPLGSILIGNRVLTKVTPNWYLRFPADSPVVPFLGGEPVEAYGRLATIHCNGDAAVEMLEVVPGRLGLGNE